MKYETHRHPNQLAVDRLNSDIPDQPTDKKYLTAGRKRGSISTKQPDVHGEP